MFLIAYVIGTQSDQGIKENSKYTIGYVTSDWHQKNGNGVGTDYEYIVENRKFYSTSVYNLKKGTKYLVMYDSIKIKNSIMLGHHQLPDNLQVPYNGWNFKQVPIKLDSADLKAYFEKLGIK